MPTERNTRNGIKTGKSVGTKQEYETDFPEWFWEKGLRVADLLILVDKGKTAEVTKQIFQQIPHVISTSWRVNTIANLFAQIYYIDSNMLNETLESVRSIDNVSKVEFSEIVAVIDRRSAAEMYRDIKALDRADLS